MQQILYDKFSYDKFYLLVWTCQQVYFDNLLVTSWPIDHIKCSDYFQASMLAFEQVHLS
jgi:hypothetical protein